MQRNVARELWHRLEAIHSITYFAPECREANKALGMRGFWMGYFASRAAPMGAVSAGAVEATFANFHPRMVQRAIPAAWVIASPQEVLESRATSAAAALARLVPDPVGVAELAGSLAELGERPSALGRPLFAANRDVAVPADHLAALWQSCTTLREHRGDGHVALLAGAGLDGCEAHVLHEATEGVAAEVLRDNRGWSKDDWSDAEQRLASRGLLDAAGRATDAGHALHAEIEHHTDELAMPPFSGLDHGAVDDLLDRLDAIVQPIRASGVLPFPNPIGLPK